jgi:taurine dioxygenase
VTGRTARHSFLRAFAKRIPAEKHEHFRQRHPIMEHPVVRTHPETGRKALFVNATFTTHIDDIPADESKAILDFLFQHISKAAFQCRFKWRPNSIAMWDNRCTLHHAMWDYYPQVRSGRRVTVMGDEPF